MASNSDAGIYRTTLKKKNSKRIDYLPIRLPYSVPLRNLCLRGELSFT